MLKGAVLPALLCLAANGLGALAASGGYFSDGWKPGQAVTTSAGTALLATATPVASVTSEVPTPASTPTPTKRGFLPDLDFARFITAGPIATALSGVGINATEHLEQARMRAEERGWDSRVPLITDDNFEDLIANEKFESKEEEENRTWFIVVTVGKQETLSKFVDEVFDSAYNITVAAGDAPHVRFGRIDYLTVTQLTTEWIIWKAPILLIVRDRGQSIRFYKPQQLRLKADLVHEFLVEEGWKETEPWSGPWAPGGSRSQYLRKFAVFSRKTYDAISIVPRWIFMLFSGLVASQLVGLFHKAPPAPPKDAAQVKKAIANRSAIVQQKSVTGSSSQAAPVYDSPSGKKNATRRRKKA